MRRQAGFFEPPEPLTSRISEWVGLVFDKLATNRSSRAKQKKFTLKAADFKDWKYFKQIAKRNPEVAARGANGDLLVKLDFNPKRFGGGKLNGRTITINASPDTWYLPYALKTLEHEMVHFGQNLLSLLLERMGIDAEAGLPSKRFQNKIQQQYRRVKNYQEKHRLHSLDDKEFYTKVRDVFKELESDFEEWISNAEDFWEHGRSENDWEAERQDKAVRMVEQLVPNMKPFIQYIVRANKNGVGVPEELQREYQTLGEDIFSVLYRENPEKWKKASKVLITALAPYLRSSTWKKALGGRIKRAMSLEGAYRTLTEKARAAFGLFSDQSEERVAKDVAFAVGSQAARLGLTSQDLLKWLQLNYNLWVRYGPKPLVPGLDLKQVKKFAIQAYESTLKRL